MLIYLILFFIATCQVSFCQNQNDLVSITELASASRYASSVKINQNIISSFSKTMLDFFKVEHGFLNSKIAEYIKENAMRYPILTKILPVGVKIKELVCNKLEIDLENSGVFLRDGYIELNIANVIFEGKIGFAYINPLRKKSRSSLETKLKEIHRDDSTLSSANSTSTFDSDISSDTESLYSFSESGSTRAINSVKSDVKKAIRASKFIFKESIKGASKMMAFVKQTSDAIFGVVGIGIGIRQINAKFVIKDNSTSHNEGSLLTFELYEDPVVDIGNMDIDIGRYGLFRYFDRARYNEKLYFSKALIPGFKVLLARKVANETISTFAQSVNEFLSTFVPAASTELAGLPSLLPHKQKLLLRSRLLGVPKIDRQGISMNFGFGFCGPALLPCTRFPNQLALDMLLVSFSYPLQNDVMTAINQIAGPKKNALFVSNGFFKIIKSAIYYYCNSDDLDIPLELSHSGSTSLTLWNLHYKLQNLVVRTLKFNQSSKFELVGNELVIDFYDVEFTTLTKFYYQISRKGQNPAVANSSDVDSAQDADSNTAGFTAGKASVNGTLDHVKISCQIYRHSNGRFYLKQSAITNTSSQINKLSAKLYSTGTAANIANRFLHSMTFFIVKPFINKFLLKFLQSDFIDLVNTFLNLFKPEFQHKLVPPYSEFLKRPAYTIDAGVSNFKILNATGLLAAIDTTISY